MLYKYIFIFGFWLSFSNLYGQTCDLTIRGVILDHHDNTILSYASIVVEGTSFGAQADSSGIYEIRGLCPGTYDLVCSHLDCEPVRKRLKITEKFTEVNFYPEHHAMELEQVIIRARSDQGLTNASETIDRQTLTSLKTASLSQNLSSIAGISILKTGSGIEKPLIHGLFGSRVSIVQQGSKLEDQQWGNEHATNVDVLMYDKIEVIKGAASVKYGAKAIAGAVILEQDKIYTGAMPKGIFIANIQSNAPGGSLALVTEQGVKNFKGLGWKLAVGAQRFGDNSAPSYVMSNTGYENYNASFSIARENSKSSNRLTLSSRYNNSGLLLASQVSSLSDLERALNASIPSVINDLTFRIEAPRQRVIHSNAIYNGSFRINEEHKLKYNASYQLNNRQEFDVRRSGRTDIPAVNMNLHTLQAELTEDHQWNEHFNGSVGITFLSQQNINVPNTQRRPLIPYYALINPGIYIFEQASWNQLTAEIGARADHISMRSKYYNISNELTEPKRKFNNALVSGGLAKRFKDLFKVKINAGIGFRAPDVNELYSDGVHLSASAYEVGNPDLLTERSLKIIAEIENDKSRRFHYVLNVFRQDFSNFIYQEKDGFISTVAGLKLRYKYLQNDAVFQGLDANVTFNANHWFSIKSKTAYVKANNLSTDKGLPLIPPFNTSLELTLHLTGKVENTAKLDLAVEGNYTAHQNRYDEDELFKVPPPSYMVYNTVIRYISKTRNKTLELKCSNLLNSKYSNYLNNLRYFSPQETGRNISIQYFYNF